ncbi:MAG: hypothetical protein JJT85_11085 [Chromatiales bacterium]|nr:hypothetical protein [Chromatiales bacterium]
MGRFQSGWLDRLDSRYAVVQELRQRFEVIAADLGGLDGLSYYQRSLIERSLWLEAVMARAEEQFAKGGEFDSTVWIQAVNSYQGIASKLGLKRAAKPVPSLSEYISRQAGK